MSRILVAADTGAAAVELVADDTDGRWSGRCSAGDWASEPGRWYDLRNLAEEAGLHVDRAHR